MAGGGHHLERRPRNRVLQPAPNIRGKEGIVPAPHDRRWCDDLLESGGDRNRIAAIERKKMRHERVASLGTREGPDIELDRPDAAVVVLVSAEKIVAENRKQPSGGKVPSQWQHGARKLHIASRPFPECNGVHET